MTATDGEVVAPIYIECEGSQCPTHYPANMFGTCQMCGQEVALDVCEGWAVKHNRLHILAMYGPAAMKKALRG